VVGGDVECGGGGDQRKPPHAATEHAARRRNYKRTARPDAQIKNKEGSAFFDYFCGLQKNAEL